MNKLKRFLGILFMAFYATISQADTIFHALQGNDIPLSSLKGKWVFVNYWASWCQPCLNEISEFNQFYDMHKAKNVAVFAINYDGASKSEQKKLIKQYDIHYPSLKNMSVDTIHLDSITAIPITFVFDPKGQLNTTLYGGQTLASLKEVIAH